MSYKVMHICRCGYLNFYNTVDANGDLLSEDETKNTMARNLALIFTECDLKITYLIESY